MGFTFITPVVGIANNANNLLEINSGVLQFGGNSVKNTTADVAGYNFKIFDSAENLGFYITDEFGPKTANIGRNAENEFVGLATGFISGNTIMSDLVAIDFGTDNSATFSLDFDAVTRYPTAGITSRINGITTSLLFDVVNTLYIMGGKVGEEYICKDSAGRNWFRYEENTSALRLGESNGLLGFFQSSPVAQQTADSLAGITFDSASLPNTVTALNELLARLQTWQAALENYSLITFS